MEGVGGGTGQGENAVINFKRFKLIKNLPREEKLFLDVNQPVMIRL